MDQTKLTKEVAHLFRISGYKVDVSVNINHREIDVRAEETQGIIRKIILVECADYEKPVGVNKIQEDFNKLAAARESLKETAVLMHVARNGYSPQASGYALEKGLAIFSIASLTSQLVNFDAYVNVIEQDKLRDIILEEYQPTKIHYDGRSQSSAKTALQFVSDWLSSESRWLTILGDYGVGKSWMLKRFLYQAIENYKGNPEHYPLPFFVPLQHFTKAFDYQNLIYRVFQINGLSGITYDAFEHLARAGKILFLFDSFDEMAQHLHRNTIRENLKELLVGVSGNSRAIMTSRPTYFEGRAERLLAIESEGFLVWHPLDQTAEERKGTLTRDLRTSIEATQFARLMDLSSSQRKKLFAVVLGKESEAYKTLIQLLNRFEELGSISQRAVIARLLTTVADTLSAQETVTTVDGYPLIPDDLHVLNQAKIFQIVVHNLLHRDSGIGNLTPGQRHYFLKCFALLLQQPGRWAFAEPEEIRSLVKRIFASQLKHSDTQEQLLEQFYRTCRRHSGLTTEGQFQDTTGQLDLPVEETDTTSRVGFSHNSLREYLVAEAFADHLLHGAEFAMLNSVSVSDTIVGFFVDMVTYEDNLRIKLAEEYSACADSKLRERYFSLIFGVVCNDLENRFSLLGNPPNLRDLDLSGLDLAGMPLVGADFSGSILPDADLRKSNLRDANFESAILDRTMLDGANLNHADFSNAEVVSIFVYDDFVTKTSSLLFGDDAQQWLYTRGGVISNPERMNPFLGKPWYEAAREVTRTLMQRIAGTHQDKSLSKGTALEYRTFASAFVGHLRRTGVLEDVRRSRKGSMLVKVSPEMRYIINDFSKNGIIAPELQSFFDKYSD